MKMWKPGDKRPRPKDSIRGMQEEEKQREPPRRTNTLSGSTMNMRFMQRKTQSTTSTSVVLKKASQDASSGFTMAVDADYPSTPVGRRSFNGFNRTVEATWKNANEQSKRDKVASTVSDEELLRRYKNFMKDGGPSTTTPVGNLSKKKIKRKRNVNT